MRIAIIGCGWVGEKLAAYLSKKGVHVIATTTTPEKIIPLEKTAEEAHLLDFTDHPDFSVLQSVDAAIFSMPISDPSWLEGFKSLDTEFPKTMLFSSTGIYPQQPGIYTEEDDANLRSDILAAESLVRSSYPQTNILRFGGLMGGDRSPKKLFARRTPEDPGKAANYIHYEDILRVVELLLNSELKGCTYNVVAPGHPTIAEIMNEPQPAENREQRIISSEKLIQDFNYHFLHPNPKNF